MSHPVPEDIYKDDVDFTTLALQYSAFAKKLKPNRQLDFTDPESVRQLTFALLHRDFNLSLKLPEDRLCPPVPNRFNYIVHLQRLLDTTNPSFRDTYDPTRQVIGLDIGTGASCIYPLLACRQREKWLMLATEIDEKSRRYATQNVDANGLDQRIKNIDTDPTSKRIIPVKQLERFHRIDFLMTNPPFYSSQEQMLGSANSKYRPPNSSCTGAPVEMIYPNPSQLPTNTSSTPKPSPTTRSELSGGELAFVTQLITESMNPSLRTRIQWFTAMLGHLSSLTTLTTLLRQHKCTNYAVWEFIQGSRTRRWGLAWSWLSLRPPLHVSRGVPGLEKKILPFPSETNIEIPLESDREEFNTNKSGGVGRSLKAIGDKINTTISTLENKDDPEAGIQWRWKDAQLTGVGMSRNGDCWSRKARRQKINKNNTTTGPDAGDEDMKDAIASTNNGAERMQTEDGASDGDSEIEVESALVFKITLTQNHTQSHTQTNKSSTNVQTLQSPNSLPVNDKQTPDVATVHIRWLQGHDAVLFESFCGWLTRKLRT